MHLKAIFFIFSLLFFSQIQYIHAQSKKEQIEVLNGRLDSLSRILVNERGVSSQKLQVYENEIRDLKSQLSKIQLGLTNTNNELNTLKIANDSLISLTDSLQNIPSLGSSKLDYEIFKWLEVHFYKEGRWRFCNKDYDNGDERKYTNLVELKLILSEVYLEQRDINNDGVLDAFVRITAPFCFSETNASPEIFQVLIYSDKKGYLKKEDMVNDLYGLLNNELETKKRMDIWFLGVNLNSFNGSDGTLSGGASIWLNDDARCCPSFSADIFYNPFTGAWSYNLKKNE
jgi:hypothetical protein